jgi:transposase
MRSVHEFATIYLHRDPIDMRKSINGLASIVEQEMKLNLFQEALFAFSNKHRDIIKILYWDKTGFALWQKRLEKEKFKWPKHLLTGSIQLSSQEVSWLLDGYDLKYFKPHKKLHYQSFS